MTERDKFIERERYDARARVQMLGDAPMTELLSGSETMPSYLRSPYIFYEEKIAELIRPNHRVLELGAGTGLHSLALLKTGAQVVVSDISPNSLRLLKQRFDGTYENLKTEVADMERLPFPDASFDVIVSAGSLSYGDPDLVDREIRRVLRSGGMLICVDSLNHNPIYRLNRWVHYIRGNRTKSTLQRMPDLSRISAISRDFSNVNVRYFGAFSFAMPIFLRLFGAYRAKLISDQLDRLVAVKRSAFKFVLIAEGLR